LELADTEQGATFLVSLPTGRTATHSGQIDVSPTAPAIDPGKGRALVVDDEPEIADSLAELLEREGYRVRIAASGTEAKTHMAATDFNLILSDLRMPDGDGASLHSWVMAERPHLASRMGFVTGDTIEPTAMAFLARAKRPSLEKPFTPAALRALVAQIVGEEG
jgi:DNA-binding NtrC family response regulator